MKAYKHWLKIDGMWDNKQTLKAYQNLINYLSEYPSSKVTIFVPKYSLFNRYICLECSQSYDDLDLDVNSHFDGSLIRLLSKPKDIEQSIRSIADYRNSLTA